MQPSRKRKRLSPDVQDASALILRDEIDLEIALRQRLAETIQSRITWALLLQESLTNGTRVEPAGVDSFRDAAVDAYDALQSPCSFLFQRELEPLHQTLDEFQSGYTASPAEPQQELPSRRLHSRINRQPARPKMLFVRNTTQNPPAIFRLRCADCARVDFPSVQGLLNHCRVKHGKDYGSHDECIHNCAVLVLDKDEAAIVEQGIEVGGVSVPSLRRLFEIAVGADEDLLACAHVSSLVSVPGAAETNVTPITENMETSTLLSKTLGHHKDTPALAPFLGKTVKRRCINIYDDGDIVDIMEDVADQLTPPKRTWRMPYMHRSVADYEPHAAPEDVRTVLVKDHVSPMPDMPTTFNTSNSRFHITVRVVIADRSLWIPPDRRRPEYKEHTYRWMLSVDSPSYSLPLSTFLDTMTVTSITHPPPSTLASPIVITEPPFIAMSTTEKPFLARVILVWADNKNSPMEVEHWIELDPFRAATPALGEQQVLDVELDRNTELLPLREDVQKVTWDHDDGPRQSIESKAWCVTAAQDSSQPSYVAILKSLLPRAPMTMKDIKFRHAIQVSYTLPASPSHFGEMTLGRRKAIEWGRARALRDAYQKISSTQISGDVQSLTTATVYRWLASEGLFLRSPASPQAHTHSKTKAVDSDLNTANDTPPSDLTILYCPTCGRAGSHGRPYFKAEFGLDSLNPMCPSADNLINQMPMVDVISLQAACDSSHHVAHDVYGLPQTVFVAQHCRPPGSLILPPRWAARHVVEVADPSLTIAIRGHLRDIKLKFFSRPPFDSEDVSSTTPVYERLEPYSLLAVVTQLFVRRLVRGGLETLVENKGTGSLPQDEPTASIQTSPRVCRLLSPAHILTGISRGRRLGGNGGVAMFLCLARLGVATAEHMEDSS